MRRVYPSSYLPPPPLGFGDNDPFVIFLQLALSAILQLLIISTFLVIFEL